MNVNVSRSPVWRHSCWADSPAHSGFIRWFRHAARVLWTIWVTARLEPWGQPCLLFLGGNQRWSESRGAQAVSWDQCSFPTLLQYVRSSQRAGTMSALLTCLNEYTHRWMNNKYQEGLRAYTLASQLNLEPLGSSFFLSALGPRKCPVLRKY